MGVQDSQGVGLEGTDVGYGLCSQLEGSTRDVCQPRALRPSSRRAEVKRGGVRIGQIRGSVD